MKRCHWVFRGLSELYDGSPAGGLTALLSVRIFQRPSVMMLRIPTEFHGSPTDWSVVESVDITENVLLVGVSEVSSYLQTYYLTPAGSFGVGSQYQIAKH